MCFFSGANLDYKIRKMYILESNINIYIIEFNKILIISVKIGLINIDLIC